MRLPSGASSMIYRDLPFTGPKLPPIAHLCRIVSNATLGHYPESEDLNCMLHNSQTRQLSLQNAELSRGHFKNILAMSKACNIAQTAICGSWILVSTLTTGGSARRNSRSDDQAQQDQHSGNFCGLLCLLN